MEKIHLPLRGAMDDEKDGLADLKELALNLRYSWNHKVDSVWRTLDPEAWELTHNPWVILNTVSREKLSKLLTDPNFSKIISELVQANRLENDTPAWFQQNYTQATVTSIAFFSMEYMLSEALPIYSGGLGNVSGDQLKAASDLGVPLVGVGLLYSQGYFRQVIDKSGKQESFFPFNDPDQLPISPVRQPDGEWLRLDLEFPGYHLWIRVWQAKVGRVKLYLLDSNDPANFPPYRGITSELYGGGSELRLMQELLLGIGGWRLLEKLGLNPEVCHLNEGHAAFAALERARSFMIETGESFETALATTRAGNLFTTHTAVAAGFDLFPPFLIEQYCAKYCREKINISLQELLALGRKNPNDASEYFNMAYLAIRASGAVNAVSELHGKVSRQIFTPLFPRWPAHEVPVGHVTNGVHMPSWDSKAADALWTEYCGKSRWLGSIEPLENDIRKISDENLWKMRNTSRIDLVAYVRDRWHRQLAVAGESPEEIERAKSIFDPNTLTLGFARRFATYKRPNMLLHDQERLIRLLANSERPIQLIIAGKAHPKDRPGQELIEQWMRFIKRPEVRGHVVFLSDYDMLLTEQLVAGVDVWINTPRRPWEACGTSGMKVLVNGGLNFSELDGWWVEAYTPEVGWALGDGAEHGDDPAWDASEARRLYDILEQEVTREFYSRDSEGLPRSFLKKIRESMATLTPRFSASRSLREYTERFYLPLAKKYLDRKKQCKSLTRWLQAIKKDFPFIRFGELHVETKENQHHFELQVYLHELDPSDVRLELYAEGINPEVMTLEKETPGSPHTYIYKANVPASRPQSDYTPRIVPYFPGVSVPLEATPILWQR
jgi:starch phosphorylase